MHVVGVVVSQAAASNRVLRRELLVFGVVAEEDHLRSELAVPVDVVVVVAAVVVLDPVCVDRVPAMP